MAGVSLDVVGFYLIWRVCAAAALKQKLTTCVLGKHAVRAGFQLI